jgi:tetratricopeptide (TPR) repeat protein
VSDILYLAMYYYRTRRYEHSLRCLQRAQERMSVPYVMYDGNVNVEIYRRAMTAVSLSDKMRKAVVSNIKLDSDYAYIDELLLEQRVSYMNGESILYIPPLVMLHMLSVLNHHRLRHTLESHQALQNLQTLLLYDDGVHVPVDQRDLSYQILGICQHVCGDYVGALNSYQCSLQQYQQHKIQQASHCRIEKLIQT